MVKERKTLEDKVSELTSLLGDEEERAKQLSKTKNKYEAIIADLEQRLAKEQEVRTSELIYVETRMWANAQRDGHPAEYRWRPLFNAAVFG